MAYGSKKKQADKIRSTVAILLANREAKGIKGEADRAAKFADGRLATYGIRRINAKVTGRFIFDFEFNQAACDLSVHAISEDLRAYQNAILDLGMWHHGYERNKKALVTALKRLPGTEQTIADILAADTIQDMRLVVKAALRRHRGSKAVNDVMGRFQFEHHAYYWFHSAYKFIRVLVNKDSTETLKKKHDNRLRINPGWIIEMATTIINKKDPSAIELGLALIAVTGRRPTEIMKTARFTKARGNSVIFEGQLKMRDRHHFESVSGYRIPTLISGKSVISLLKKLRAMTSDVQLSFFDVRGNKIKALLNDPGMLMNREHNDAVKDHYNTDLNTALKKSAQSKEITCKTLRAAWAMMTYDDHRNDGESASAYRGRVLGYSASSFGAQLNYEQVELDRQVTSVKAPAKPADTTDKKLVQVLESITDQVVAQSRAKAIHRIHDKYLAAAKAGELTMDQVGPGLVRAEVVNGKKINPMTCQKYANLIKYGQWEVTAKLK